MSSDKFLGWRVVTGCFIVLATTSGLGFYGLAVYLNALAGKGVHIITVNDYLARRDAVWYAPVYALLGMTVGVIQNNFISYMYEAGYRPEEEEAQEGLDDLRPATRAARCRALRRRTVPAG